MQGVGFMQGVGSCKACLRSHRACSPAYPRKLRRPDHWMRQRRHVRQDAQVRPDLDMRQVRERSTTCSDAGRGGDSSGRVLGRG